MSILKPCGDRAHRRPRVAIYRTPVVWYSSNTVALGARHIVGWFDSASPLRTRDLVAMGSHRSTQGQR